MVNANPVDSFHRPQLHPPKQPIEDNDAPIREQACHRIIVSW